MNDLLIIFGITLAITVVLILVFYLGYLYGRISEKQEMWEQERREK